ncbi:class I SAM-dependent methyltransferase [Acuticoccus sp.]|uniref:class I SAM-dependent methyltransferase n=1 Tax=Acuticoccus sp. TaxID=1904378 RepID=UPI003B527EC8
MSAASLTDLTAIYATSPDPWQFRTSPYERAKFVATLEALARPTYGAILEVGCGNGELGRLLRRRCERYVGLDAVASALDEARRAVPDGEFVEAYLPGPLPDGAFDAVVLSEILYFLDADGIGTLTREIAGRWPGAEVLAVHYRPCETGLTGDAAVAIAAAALTPTFGHEPVAMTDAYRIDRFVAAQR